MVMAPIIYKKSRVRINLSKFVRASRVLVFSLREDTDSMALSSDKINAPQ
jgi:hypothetical protein